MAHDAHDALAKAMFSRPEYAAQEFRAALPAAVVERLDLRALRLCPGSFVDEDLRKTHTDLLFSVPLSGRRAFAYLLLEHQSTVHRHMPVRLWKYVGRIWDRYITEHPGATRLPATVSVVLHHSDKGWTAATSMSELFDLDDETERALGPYLPRLRFVLDDLSVQSDDELRARVMAALPRLALVVLKNARGRADMDLVLARCVDEVREALSGATGVEMLGRIVRYTLAVSETEPAELERVLIQAAGPPGREAYMTGAEKLSRRAYDSGLKEGRDSGLKEGRDNGLKEGRELAVRGMLLRQLRQRFGELPDTATRRIERADVAQLETWGDRVLTAATLDEVLGEPTR